MSNGEFINKSYFLRRKPTQGVESESMHDIFTEPEELSPDHLQELRSANYVVRMDLTQLDDIYGGPAVNIYILSDKKYNIYLTDRSPHLLHNSTVTQKSPTLVYNRSLSRGGYSLYALKAFPVANFEEGASTVSFVMPTEELTPAIINAMIATVFEHAKDEIGIASDFEDRCKGLFELDRNFLPAFIEGVKGDK